MLINALGRPYSGEFHTVTGSEYALLQEPNSCIQPTAIHQRRSPGGGRVACGTFRVDRLCGYRVALQAERIVEQPARLHSPAELVARMTGPLGACKISAACIVQRSRHAHEAPLLVEAQVSHGIEEFLPLEAERVGGSAGVDRKCINRAGIN